jgi:hypothetical protein
MHSTRWQYLVLKKIASSQLTFEKRKWILKCFWKTENVTKIQRSWRNKFGIWCWWLTFWIFVTLNAKYYNSVSFCVSFEHPKCVYIFGTLCSYTSEKRAFYIQCTISAFGDEPRRMPKVIRFGKQCSCHVQGESEYDNTNVCQNARQLSTFDAAHFRKP